MFDLHGMTALVTGASGGIGSSIARGLAAQGARLAISGSNQAKLNAFREELDEHTPQHLQDVDHVAIACDLSNAEQVEKLVPAALDSLGKIDILINNAGITQPIKTLDISPANYEAVLDVNLRGTLYMSQAVLPAMRAQRRGSIVCMSSVSAQRGGGIFGGPHYSAAKAGVLGLARAMAREFGPDNVRVNSVTPGLIQTDITGGKLTDAMRVDILKGIPLNRLGDAQDVANACLFLASDLSSYLTGVTLDVNGGMLIH